MDYDPLPSTPLSPAMMLLANLITFHAPDTLTWGLWAVIIAIAAGCLLMSAFVSGSEIAFFGLTGEDIDELKHNSEKNKAAQTALALIRDSERLLPPS